MSPKPCPFVWHDLITTDVAGAKAFYTAVIGWNMRAFGPGTDYTVLSAGSVGMGGIMPMPQEACDRGAPVCWQGYIAVEDVDACAKLITAKGGSIIMAAQDIPNVGRFALAADPQGAVFIIFKPNPMDTPIPSAPPGAPGLVGWNELHAAENLSAFDWYADVFGWTLSRDMDMGDMGVYRIFATGGEAVGGMMTKMPQLPKPFWTYYFNVDAINAAVERATQNGGKLINGPHEVPGPMYVANCQDPQGAMFGLVAPKR
jgi:predicted enzyme related to lactoylglutathione lyase